MNLPEHYRKDLLKFTFKSASTLRKKWRKYKGDTCKSTHKKFCYAAGAHYGVPARVIHFIMKCRDWQDLKPAIHVKTLPDKILARETDLDINLIVRNNKININSALWSDLNSKFSKRQIKNLIINAIRSKNLPPPYQPISKKQADKAFAKLKLSDSRALIRRVPTCTRWEYRYEISDVVIDAPITCNDASNYYHQKSRWLCDYKSILGPTNVWNSDNQLRSLLNAAWTLKFNKLTDKEIRNALSLRKYVASQFKPTAAKCFYELFNSRKVYDPSSGWGDRVCGFLAARDTEFYCSTDPNSRLYSDYSREVSRYKTNQTVEMYCHGSELSGGMRKRYGHTGDTVFTSPPYFNAEQYSDDEGQSYKKNSNIDLWLENFLYPTIKNSWDFLRDYDADTRGGILAINISDIYDDSTGSRGVICDPMNDFISKLPGARYVGCIGLRLSKRPQSGALEGKEGASIEPIWIWAKEGKWTLEDYIENGFSSYKKTKSIFDINIKR